MRLVFKLNQKQLKSQRIQIYSYNLNLYCEQLL